MSDFQSEMNRVVAGFVTQITELARAAARDMIDQALGHGGRLSAPRANASRKRGTRRTSADVERSCEAVHAFVAKHPGVRVEQINKQLGTTTSELALPIRKLIADGLLRSKGKRRATTYFASDKKRD